MPYKGRNYIGAGHLDDCNGRWTKTPEFPNGMYIYVLNIGTNGKPEFPGVPYCLQAEDESSPHASPGGTPSAGGTAPSRPSPAGGGTAPSPSTGGTRPACSADLKPCTSGPLSGGKCPDGSDMLCDPPAGGGTPPQGGMPNRGEAQPTTPAPQVPPTPAPLRDNEATPATPTTTSSAPSATIGAVYASGSTGMPIPLLAFAMGAMVAI